ncbi:MAG: hypothetical protein A2W99_01860 [Bacteroidetes bacterium GWF2_33_16]|nr:MAG: hypothetical protein A2X00_16295 [Bacteroidetes bacterium GWE2_32_14]OFY07015.1 MAG: hypothetical protein A2W99_01860 [Bacteroidetes bacterium GWF2_33_16]
MNPKRKHRVKISSFFSPENIEFYGDPINTDQLVLKLLQNLALNYGIGNVVSLFNNIYQNNRTKLLTNNCKPKIVTFPLHNTDKTLIAIAIAKNNTDNPPSESSELLIIITYPKANPDIILKVKKAFNDYFINPDFINEILQSKNSKSIWNIFDQADIFLADTILVQDYMDIVEVYLNESNNLKDAIDMFLKTKKLNIPVIDVEGNLIGEVTAKELMDVCLPRYILWMDDIDPIVHFEPFQNMLEQEENTWLAEILHYNVSVVQKNEPLMKAAIQMTKREVSQAYVLDDKKLVGIITIESFLNTILRA